MKSINIIVAVLAIVVGFTSISFARDSKLSKFNRFPIDEIQKVLEAPDNYYCDYEVQNIQILKKRVIGRSEYEKYVGKKAEYAGKNKYARITNDLLFSNLAGADVQMMFIVYTADLVRGNKIKPMVSMIVFYSVVNYESVYKNKVKEQLIDVRIGSKVVKSQKKYDKWTKEYLKNLKILVNG